MKTIKLKGHEFAGVGINSSYNRRAQMFKNNIITSLHALGLHRDDVDIQLEPMAIKKIPAKALWYMGGCRLYFSYKACRSYVENLYVISKLIALEVQAILEGKKTVDEFISDFSEGDKVEDERKEAREFLGIDECSLDLDLINKRYRDLAKDAHPDKPNGDVEKFKALNHAHKILKRELA